MWKRTGKISRGCSAGSLLLLFLSPFFGSVEAQELSTSVNKNPVPPGERFEYSIVLQGADGDIQAPELDAFPRVMGPSRSTQVRVINGNMSRKITESYQIIAPKEEGTYRIGKAKARTKDGELEGAAIELKVSADAGGKKGAKGDKGSPALSGQKDKRLIARIRTNKSSAYKGELVRVTYELYSRYRSVRFGQQKFPSVDGAWSEELEDGSGWKDDIEHIDGKPYRKAVLRRSLIYPQESGKIRIEPMELTCIVNRGFFNKGEKVKVKSNSPSIEVKPHPEGAPESFTGAVGDLELEAGLDRTKVKTDGSVNLKVKIKGTGNFKLMGAPDIELPSDLEHYDPNVERKLDVGAYGISGIKGWEYLIVPRQSGSYKIGPIEFSYFDPEKESYRTERAGPFELEVEEGEGRSPQSPPSKSKERVSVLEEELRYLHTPVEDLEPKEEGERMLGSLPFIPPLAGALFFLLMGRLKRAGEQKSSKERKTAKARLRDAEKALKKGDRNAFHEELYKGLQSYLSDRTGIPFSELSKERIGARMKEKGIPEELTEKTVKTLENSEMLRYAPAQDISDEEVQEESVRLLAELEKHWK